MPRKQNRGGSGDAYDDVKTRRGDRRASRKARRRQARRQLNSLELQDLEEIYFSSRQRPSNFAY